MNKRRKSYGISLVVFGVLLILMSAYAITLTVPVSTSGVISNMGIYWDAACTNRTININWGDAILPGSTVPIDLYIKNVASYNVTLTMTDSAWSPSNIPAYISIWWNRENYLLASGFVVAAHLVLTVDADIGYSDPLIGAFSFNITITGTG
jgi:hypothetical protein